MPELPEVETVRLGLSRALAGAKIAQVTLRRADLRTPFPDGFARALAGRTIVAVRRRAKYLLFDLDNGWALIAHLGMTGRFTVSPPPAAYAAHDHVILALQDGRCVVYNDARRFGVMALCEPGQEGAHPLLAHLGPEPLDRAFSAAYLKPVLAARKAPIKPVLMDQAVVVGVGNIYASEALFLAGVSPVRPACEVVRKVPRLIACIQQVLQAAIASGGSSLKDFLHVSGESGYFQHQFNVYDREGEACNVCRNPILAIRQAGRSTFYCGKCQG